MKKTFLFLAALAMSAMTWAGETKTLIIDGSQLTSTATSAVTDFTYGDFTIAMSDGAKFQASSGDNRFEGTDKAILIGKSGKYIYNKTPFGKITKFEIYANKGASAKVSVGVLFSTTAISEYATGDNTYTATLSTVDKVYDCSDKIPEGAKYFWYQVTNANNSQVMFRITYEEGTTPTRVLESIYISGTAEKLEYFVGEEFDPAGLKVMGKYDTGDDTEITAGIVWTIDPETFAEASENASVTLSASYKDKTTADTTITGIKVSEPAPLPKYATIYTSNVELTTTGGTSASAAKVVVAEGDTVDALKAGTGSAAGSVVVSIPTTTKTLHFHVVGWKGATVQLDINGEKLDITSEDGITSNSPFTLKGDAYDYYYAIDPQGATSITFTAATGNRFVLFGVNAELPEGIVAAPTFSPAVTTFESSVEVSLACETEGADIYYTLDGTDPTTASTKYETPFTLTETTTVKAIAKKDDKTSEVAEKTYVKAVFASLEELVTYMPATKDAVTVTVTLTDVAIDSFYVSSKGYTNGVYVTAASTVVELYTNDVPETWEAGGKISGTIKAQWNLYNGVAELQKWDGAWEAFTYTDSVSEADLVSITLSLDKDTLYQNKEFKYNGTVMANYSDETTKDVTKTATFTGYDMTTLGDQLVTVSYTEGEVTKEAQYTLTVVEKVLPSEYAAIYTSNVEFTAEGGTKATLSQVVVAEGDTVDAIKCGTSSVDGACVITIPAATKTLHFHAVAWSNKPTTMDVNGTVFDLTADSGISGNGSTYTLAGEPSDYYFSFDPKGATSITFAAKSDHRFVLFGVNAELEEGTVASPTFTPSATDFEGFVEVSLACETEGAEIFYALNEEVTSMNAIKYTEPIKLTETTTIYAVAKKDGKESEQVSKTYTLIPAFESLDALVENLPATDTKVKVKVTLTDVAIDSFYVSGKYTNGVYVTANGAALELYKYDVPATWEVGGTISGTIIADWNLYKGVPELQNFDSWDAFTYNAPVPVVPTTFNVTVPAGTDACYLVGTLNAWNIGEPIAMTKVDDTHYTYTAEEDLTGAEYKYVHGADWKYVEKNADGSEMGNRVVNDVVMNDVVAMWADQTALNNINANKKAAKQIVNGQIVIIRDNRTYNVLGF